MAAYGDEVLNKRVFVEFLHSDGALRPYGGIVQRKIEWTELDNAGNLICKVKHEVRFEEIGDVRLLDLKEKEDANQLMWWYDGNDVDAASTPISKSSQYCSGNLQYEEQNRHLEWSARSDASTSFDSNEDSGINSTDDSSFGASQASCDDASDNSSDEPTDDSSYNSSDDSSVGTSIVHVKRETCETAPRIRAKRGKKERRSSWRRAMEERFPEWLQCMCMIGGDMTTAMPEKS
jgi:hypothetical protein